MSTYLKHTFIYFISKGLPGVLSLLAILYYSDALDPADYGVYSLIISAIGILNIIFFDWFRFGVARLLPEYTANNNRDYFISFVNSKVQVTLLIVCLLTGVAFITFPYFPENSIERWMIPVIGLLAALQYLYILYTRIVVTELMPKLFMIANFIKTLIGVLLSVFLVYLGMGFKGLLFGLGSGLVASIFFLLLKIKLPRPLFSFKVNRKLLINIVTYSLPLAASAGLSFILSYSNRFIINYYRGTEETGLFSLGFDFSQQTVGVFISIAATSAFPIAMKLYSESGNSEKLKKHMNDSLLLLCMISLPIVAIFAANSADISNLLLGDKFDSLDPLVIPIISLNTFILGIKSFYFDLYFYLKKETKYQLGILFIVALINVLCNILFVSKYGYIVAVWSGLFTSSLAVILTFLITRKLLIVPLDYFKIIKILVLSFLTFLLMKFIGDSESMFFFIIKIVSGLMFYLCVIAIFNKEAVLKIINKKIG